MRKIITVVFLIILPVIAFAQRGKDRWKGYRAEVHLGLGASNFLGELGGANQIGTNYYKDLEFSQTRFAACLGLRYKLNPYFGLNTKFTYGRVSGSDKLTDEFFRNYRNLSFRSNIFELSTNLEISFIREQIGHRYRLRGVRGQRGFEMSAYLFLGAGVFHFDPKTTIDGQTVRLQPLGTEGQGVDPARKKYKLTQFCIPVGIGFKYTFNRRWGVGLEYGARKTFTDYIDDVSKTYVDPNYLESDLARQLADRSDKQFPAITAPGQQRGDPRDKDSYMFAILSVNYKLRTGRVAYPLF